MSVAVECLLALTSDSVAMKYALRSMSVGISVPGGMSFTTRAVTVLRTAADSSAATSPRSIRIGGANPRDRARSSSSASFDCAIASVMSVLAFSGSASSWRSAAARSICRRTRRCCGPSWMSRSNRRSE